MSTKTKWERFCDWLDWPPAPPPKPLEPIRPFVLKLVECMRLGDCKLDVNMSYSALRFALGEDLSATIYDWCYDGGIKCYAGGSQATLTPPESKLLNDEWKAYIDRLFAKRAKEQEDAQAAAIAKIEAYTPKPPSA
jgi:hypothetical protein